jgi:hypothetical protein
MYRTFFLMSALSCLCAASSLAPPASAKVPPMTAAYIIKKVSAHYGVAKPRVLHLEKTLTDSTPHEMMYFVEIAGAFHRGRTQARYIYFSALAGRWYVWGLRAYDLHHHLRWADASVRKQ